MAIISRTTAQLWVKILGFVSLFLLYIQPAIAKNENILILRPVGKQFESVVKGMAELKEEYKINEFLVEKNSDVSDIKSNIEKFSPAMVVLMDNRTIALYKKYENTLPKEKHKVPCFALMGVQMSSAIKGLQNINAISYEVPIVTSIVNLRNIVGRPIPKVGIIHREFMQNFIKENALYAKKEGIKIVNISLPNKHNNYRKLIGKALKKLVKKEKVDAIWVPNDNALLQAEIIAKVWVSNVKKYDIPAIVGVQVLVDSKLNFGTFAVLPDHQSLGEQAAGRIFEIAENEWRLENGLVVPPLSVFKIINLKLAKKIFKISKKNLENVDKITE